MGKIFSPEGGGAAGGILKGDPGGLCTLGERGVS